MTLRPPPRHRAAIFHDPSGASSLGVTVECFTPASVDTKAEVDVDFDGEVVTVRLRRGSKPVFTIQQEVK